jgi:hypothetical protein
VDNEQKRNPPAKPVPHHKDLWERFVRKIERKLQEREAKKNAENPVDRAARITAKATGWMALFTFVLAATSVGTIWILKNQLTEMHESGVDAQKAVRLEQRAWVGFQGTTPPTGFTETTPWKITAIFFNSGRTPAHNVRTSMRFITSPVPLSGPSPEQIKQLEFRPNQSIAPQGFYRENIGNDSAAEASSSSQISGVATLTSQYKLIRDKHLLLYYFGLLKYDDSFGAEHETQWCIYLANPDTKESGVCDAFNELN